MSDTPKLLPKALYSCQECGSEYSWPLHWDAAKKAWFCRECYSGNHGAPVLKDILESETIRQKAEIAELVAALAASMKNAMADDPAEWNRLNAILAKHLTPPGDVVRGPLGERARK